jgi:hypothetical protein
MFSTGVRYGAGMVRERWWWNGKWGRIARRDVMIHRDDVVFYVVARSGGAEGRSRQYAATDAADAQRLADRFMATDERWREMT